MFVCMYVCMYVPMHIHVCIHMFMRMYVCSMYGYVYMYLCIVQYCINYRLESINTYSINKQKYKIVLLECYRSSYLYDMIIIVLKSLHVDVLVVSLVGS